MNDKTTTPTPANTTTLLSQEVAEETSNILKRFKKEVAKPEDAWKFNSGKTVEELVLELLKPHVSEWLNANLPAMVKRMVEKEMQKITQGD